MIFDVYSVVADPEPYNNHLLGYKLCSFATEAKSAGVKVRLFFSGFSQAFLFHP